MQRNQGSEHRLSTFIAPQRLKQQLHAYIKPTVGDWFQTELWRHLGFKSRFGLELYNLVLETFITII